MPIYSETISNEELNKIVSEDVEKVLIIGCGACMNESLAFKNNLPITIDLDSENSSPYSTSVELSRIKNSLCERCHVETVCFNDINGFLCSHNLEHEEHPIHYSITPDVILALCCSAGFNAIKGLFPNIKVIKITRQKGTLYYGFHDKDGRRIISKENSGVLAFNRSDTKGK